MTVSSAFMPPFPIPIKIFVVRRSGRQRWLPVPYRIIQGEMYGTIRQISSEMDVLYLTVPYNWRIVPGSKWYGTVRYGTGSHVCGKIPLSCLLLNPTTTVPVAIRVAVTVGFCDRVEIRVIVVRPSLVVFVVVPAVSGRALAVWVEGTGRCIVDGHALGLVEMQT